jgi:hypothetical protein
VIIPKVIGLVGHGFTACMIAWARRSISSVECTSVTQ